ncbi:hypothetical protein [Candidatus Uabimicrobium sp. HlEnr_7]|uniref:hypothetical protein n=1 Tax=Candidatus Uabimicrobium helgolandensis TaxID=3095367 RepID=UPI003558A756
MSGLIEITCSNCSKTLKVPKARSGQNGKCAYCGDSVFIPYEEEVTSTMTKMVSPQHESQEKQQNEYALPKARSSASYQPPKYKKRKNTTTNVTLWCLVTFVVGNTTGYMFSEHIDRFFGASSDVSNTNNSIVHVTPKKTVSNSTSPEIVDLNIAEKNPVDVSKTQDILEKTKVSIDELEIVVKSLDKNANQLFARYNINVGEDTYNYIESSNKELKLGRSICENASRVLEKKEAEKLSQINSQLQDTIYRNEQLREKVKQKDIALKKQLSQYNKSSSRKNGKISSKYMGKWYIKLLKSTKKVDVIYGRINITTHSASVKYRAIQNEIKRIKNYGKDVKKATKILMQRIDSGKEPFSWIENRRQSARSIPQKKQADALETFLKNNKKFEVDITSEYKELRQATQSIHKQNETRLLAETTLRSILRALQTINRKWEEEYQTFDSAVSNFAIKE